MGRYTDSLQDLSFDLYPDDDDFEQKLAEVAGQFRPFDVALTAFLVENGMIGETASADEIVEFITGRFKAAGIEPPRHRKKWFSEHKSIKRDTAFDLCFALGLSLDQAEDFFRRVCLERGFDGHDMKRSSSGMRFVRGFRMRRHRKSSGRSRRSRQRTRSEKARSSTRR